MGNCINKRSPSMPAAVAVACLPACAIAANCSGTTTIHINYSSPTSPLTLEYGVDAKTGPRCDNGAGGEEVAEALREMGVSLIRTHDSGVLDWPVVFPHSLALNATGSPTTASTSDPANYDWDAADTYFDSIVGAGFEPYLRLGTSYNQVGGGAPLLPPTGSYNATALVDVLLHIVKHYNDGWGSKSSRNTRPASGRTVRYLEIWNEPDSSCDWSRSVSCGRFWNRSHADFYALVDATARALKRYDSGLIVGAPGVANAVEVQPGAGAGVGRRGAEQSRAGVGATEEEGSRKGGEWSNREMVVENPYSWGLVRYLGERKTPIDFFSFHGYIANGSWYAATAAAAAAQLQQAGLGHVAVHVTEWFPCILCMEQDSAAGAAAAGASLTRMAQAGVAVATLYPLCSSAGAGNRTGGRGWGLFDQESEPGRARWRKLTHAVASFGEIAQAAGHVLVAEVEVEVEAGIKAEAETKAEGQAAAEVRDLVKVTEHTAEQVAVLAGRQDPDQGQQEPPGELKVLVSDQRPGNCSRFTLKVRGLDPAPARAGWEYSVVVIDSERTMAAVAGGVVQVKEGGVLELTFELGAPAVALVRMRMQADWKQDRR